MINEEQLEAATARLTEDLEKRRRAHGWRFGRKYENRQQRIKRIRRWRKIEGTFPDKIDQRPWPEDRTFAKPELALKKQFPGFEVMITRVMRKIPPGIDEPEWVWRDLASWKEIPQYNGYCRFMSKPVIERGYDGFLTYVPVHGGITYANFDAGTATYGFDTAHADDENNPQVRNLEWIEFQAWFMAKAIKLAALYEPAYLRSECRYHRAKVIDAYHAKVSKLTQQPFVLLNNLGSMINILCGEL